MLVDKMQGTLLEMGIEARGRNGHVLEIYGTQPTPSHEATMCSCWDLNYYKEAAVAAVRHSKLVNVR